MIDPNGYRDLIMARAAALKAERDEREAALAQAQTQYADALADLKALLAPLQTVWALLPSSVKRILEKYRT